VRIPPVPDGETLLNINAFYTWLNEENLQPEMVEDDTEIAICCPICSDDRPRLYISADHGGWICFHCHESGNLHQFLMEIGEVTGSKAMSLRMEFTDPDDEEFERIPRPDKPPVDAVLELPASFKHIDDSTPQEYLWYLEARGVSKELAIARGIGYSTSGKYAWRIIVPVQSDGKLFSYIARTILTQCPSCRERINGCVCTPRKFPKVLTPLKKEGAQPRHTVYNFDAVNSSQGRLIIVEGVFDALRYPNEAVAVLGSSASTTQVALIAGMARGRDTIIALDPDTAGYLGAIKIADALASKLVPVRVALLPRGEDIGSLGGVWAEIYLSNAKRYIL